MTLVHETKWLLFYILPRKDNRKTDEFIVKSASDMSTLCVIKYHVGYRKYAQFVTSSVYANESKSQYEIDTKIFDDECLQSIVDFIKKLNQERKKKNETERSNETTQ
jgi:hypothetical protein